MMAAMPSCTIVREDYRPTCLIQTIPSPFARQETTFAHLTKVIFLPLYSPVFSGFKLIDTSAFEKAAELIAQNKILGFLAFFCCAITPFEIINKQKTERNFTNFVFIILINYLETFELK